MKFKEFEVWCNKRAADGCWSIYTAMYCTGVVDRVREKPFWKREKEWQRINCKEKVFENVVSVINEKIKEFYGVQL